MRGLITATRRWFLKKLLSYERFGHVALDTLHHRRGRWYQDAYEYFAEVDTPKSIEHYGIGSMVQSSLRDADLQLECKLVPRRIKNAVTENNVLLNCLKNHGAVPGGLHPAVMLNEPLDYAAKVQREQMDDLYQHTFQEFEDKSK